MVVLAVRQCASCCWWRGVGRRAAGSFTARESPTALSEALLQQQRQQQQQEQQPVAAVVAKADDLVTVTGLQTAKLGSIIQLNHSRTTPPVMALVVSLPKEHTVAALLHRHADVREGDEVSLLHDFPQFSVNEELKSRIVDVFGKPIDGKPEIDSASSHSIACPMLNVRAPSIVHRDRLTPRHIQSGNKMLDFWHPLAHGRRVAFVGERRVGKREIALQVVCELARRQQLDRPMHFVYASIGHSRRHVASIYDRLQRNSALDSTTLIVANDTDSFATQYLSAFSACALAEFYRSRGEDAFVVFDNLSNHAEAFINLSRSARLPVQQVRGVHSQLLERFAALSPSRGGGSSTALCLVDAVAVHTDGTKLGSEGARCEEYISSVVDDTVQFSTQLLRERIYPPVDLRSRVGKAPPPFVRGVLRSLMLQMRHRLAESLEARSVSNIRKQLGIEWDEETLRLLEFRDKMVALLQQRQALSRADELLLLSAVTSEDFDFAPVKKMDLFEDAFLGFVRSHHADLYEQLNKLSMTSDLSQKLSTRIDQIVSEFVRSTSW